MAASEGFLEHIRDLLRGLGPISARRMFGGAGIYADGVMFALVADDTLYLKTDDDTKAAFEAEGSAAFGYEGKNRRIDLPYWRAPERLFDDPDEMTEWARIALGVARRTAANKAKRPGRTAARKTRPRA